MKKIIIVFFSLLGISLFCSPSFADSTTTQLVDQQKQIVLKAYDSHYQNALKYYQSSGMLAMQSLDYQALHCLGVLTGEDILLAMQNDYKTLRLGFLNSIAAVEVDALFGTGISALSGLVATHLQLAQQFEDQYIKKTALFVSDIQTYSKKNSTLVAALSSKLAKLKTISDSQQQLSGRIQDIKRLISGTGSAYFFDRLETLKTNTVNSLSLSLQDRITYQVKKYPILKTLSGTLAEQKMYSLRMFALDFDEKVNLLFSRRYDAKAYQSLVQDQQKFVAKYTCQNILTSSTFDSEAVSLSTKIQSFLKGLDSVSSSSASGFQQQVTSRFTNIMTLNTQYLAQFATTIKTITAQQLVQYKSGSVVQNLSSGSVVSSSFVFPSNFVFSRALKKGESGYDVEVLQQLLKQLNIYTGAITRQYTTQTIQSVYQFQRNYGLLVGYEKRPQTRGWMGPATRVKLNETLKNLSQ